MQPHLAVPYSELALVDQEDNRAAARRIPEVLALAGLALHRPEPPADFEVHDSAATSEHLAHHLERLAEAEHDGWVAHKLSNSWRLGAPRDDSQKVHPALVPYARLAEVDKEKDRNSVRHFPDMVRGAGYVIVLLADRAEPAPVHRSVG
jgi:hypothetical protein